MVESSGIYKEEINLIPRELLALRQKKRERYYLIIALVSIGLFFICIYLYPEIVIRSYENRLVRGEEAGSLLKEREKEKVHASLLAREEDCQKILQAFKEIEGRSKDVVELLNTFSSILPPEIKMDSFHLRGNERLDVSFRVRNPVQVLELMVILENLGLFNLEHLRQIPLTDREESVAFVLYFKN